MDFYQETGDRRESAIRIINGDFFLILSPEKQEKLYNSEWLHTFLDEKYSYIQISEDLREIHFTITDEFWDKYQYRSVYRKFKIQYAKDLANTLEKIWIMDMINGVPKKDRIIHVYEIYENTGEILDEYTYEYRYLPYYEG